MDNQVVVFQLGTEECGVSISSVDSILKMQAVGEGVSNLPGKALPVMDLRTRLGLPPQKQDKDSRVIIINVTGLEVDMVVDGVSAALTISAQSVEAPPAIASTAGANFITGITRVDRSLVVLLELDPLLSSDEQESPTGAV